ncbi:hypothetical protein KQI72_06330 [Eubacterium sp. MSJ-21]|nr:hypothetical protein [Eubacterium sp. MSJ-21]
MEQHILAPGLNKSELIKSLGLYGKNCFNLHIDNGLSLAKEALLRAGIAIAKHIISADEEFMLFTQALQGIRYFETVKYADVQKIASAVRTMRVMIGMGEEGTQLREKLGKGIFQEKNQALWQVYEAYMQLLEAQKWTDTIQIMRWAIAECDAWEQPVTVLEEYPLTPLEWALAEKLSGGKVRTVPFRVLYQAEQKPTKLASINMCYGMANEVETILQDVYETKALDQCTVALTDYNSYSQIFYDYSVSHAIPITFGRGVSITNTVPAMLLRKYEHWSTDGFFDAASLRSMLEYPFFDQKAWLKQIGYFPENEEAWMVDVNTSNEIESFYQFVAKCRFTNDAETNQRRIRDLQHALELESFLYASADTTLGVYLELSENKSYLPLLKNTAEELALPVEEFIARYARVRQPENADTESYLTMIDQEAVQVIRRKCRAIRMVNSGQAGADSFSDIYREMVGAQSACAGAVHVTDIAGAMSSIRQNVYVAGLAASKYPKYQQENFLLLDADIEQFGSEAAGMRSTEKTNQRRMELLRLAHMTCALSGALHLSYAGLDVSELKNENASSVIYELCQEEQGGTITNKELENRIRKVGYFDPAISSTRLVGQAYNAGEQIVFQGATEESNTGSTKEYTVNEWVQKFKYVRVMEPDASSGVFRVLTEKATEGLLDRLIKRCIAKSLTIEEYRQIASKLFEQYILKNPPVYEVDIENVRQQFLGMVELTHDAVTCANAKKLNTMCRVLEDGTWIVGCPDIIKRRSTGEYDFIKFDVSEWRELPSGKYDDVEIRYYNSMKWQFEKAMREQLAMYRKLLEKCGYTVGSGTIKNIRINQSYTETK